jgi:hypothetical protein
MGARATMTRRARRTISNRGSFFIARIASLLEEVKNSKKVLECWTAQDSQE